MKLLLGDGIMDELIINNLNDRDKVIRTLADVKLTCHLRLKSGTCKGHECDDCFKYQTYCSCLEQMSDFDKLQIDNIYESEYSKLNIRQFSTPKSESVKPKSKLISKLKDFGKYMSLWFALFVFIYGIISFFTRGEPAVFHLCMVGIVIYWLVGSLCFIFVILGSD